MVSTIRTQHLAPVFTGTRLALYWWACLLVAAFVLGHAFDHVGAPEVTAMGPAFWVMAGLVVLGDLRPIVASGSYDPQGVNLSTAFVFATLVLWGIAPAALLLLLGTPLGEAVKRKRTWIALFNTAQHLLAYAAAAGVMWVLGLGGAPSAPLELQPEHLVGVLAGAVAYHLVNIALVARMLSLESGRSWWDEFTEDFGYYSVTTFAVLALSPVIVAVVDEGWPFVLLLLPPLLAVYRTAQMSLRQEHESLHDQLTGLPNRALLHQRAEDALARTTQDGTSVALALLDLDRFKEVNDTLGHHTGDELLRLVARRIGRTLRDGDTVARLGGDEFALLLTGVAGHDEALEAADRVRAALTEPFNLDDLLLDLDASVGIAFGPEHGGDVEALMRCADVAMYEAKDSRRGVEIYAHARDRHTVSRLGMLGDLRRAVTRRQLAVHYQPQVALDSRRIIGVEALVRWEHPDHGVIGPDDFLPLAEQAGLMRAITQIVLEQALARVAAWRRDGIAVPVAVNISVHDLSDPGFVGAVAAGLRSHDLPPALLRLEVTEHALMADLQRLAPALRDLEQLGVRLSLDDFGTGYSSLAHLRRLPISELKIDRAFVQRMTDEDVVIMRAIVQLAHRLGMTTVAEGVETAEIWRALRDLGCDAAQGWLLSRALPADAATACLRRHHLRHEAPPEHPAPALDPAVGHPT